MLPFKRLFALLILLSIAFAAVHATDNADVFDDEDTDDDGFDQMGLEENPIDQLNGSYPIPQSPGSEYSVGNDQQGAYQQPPAVGYQAQQPPVVYQQSNYSQSIPVSPIPVYQQPPVVYQQSNYSQSIPVSPVPVYQQPAQNYAQPSQQAYLQPQPQIQLQSQPLIQLQSQPLIQQQTIPHPQIPLPIPQPQVPYNKPYAPVIPQTPYVAQQSNYTTKITGQPSAHQNGLLSLTNNNGYLPNSFQSSYFKKALYQQNCPKNVYLTLPSQKDILDAFAYAEAQLAKVRGSTISYVDKTSQSFAARHAIFSFLNQHSPRMDEEGLLVEYVSAYLASRSCMTKWDKQRYLPTLTKLINPVQFPKGHSCMNQYTKLNNNETKQCANYKYRTFDGWCNNPLHPYWGKSDVCHLRLLSPDYADGISAPRTSLNLAYPLPNPRILSTSVHFDLPLEGLYNLMKMQWGQFINHDITNTALSSFDGLVDCCKNPSVRGCFPIYLPAGDKFYSAHNVTCLNFIRSGVCALCQLGPRQQSNKNTAFLDLSHIYGNNLATANKLRSFKGGLLIESVSKNGEPIPPIASGQSQDTCTGICFIAGDNRVNQHPTLTALHTLLLRRHNQHARALAIRHPQWGDELIFQEARRLNIAEYQMITYNEYFPIVFGPILSSYYKLYTLKTGYTQWNPSVDPTTWNEYSTAACRFGHSQVSSTYGLYNQLFSYKQQSNQPTYRLKEWFMRPSMIFEGQTSHLIHGLLSKSSDVVDPWISGDVREHLYKNPKDATGGDLAATNVLRGRDHGIPGYVHYLEYCFNYKVYSWKDLELFIPPNQLSNLQKVYGIFENIDLFTGGLAERHFPGADTGPTFACINGIQYYHLKFGDRYYFEHANQPGSFNPKQLDAIRGSTLSRFLCRTAYLKHVPNYAFLAVSQFNPAVSCEQLGEIDYNLF